jgi:hypothetical protein
MISYSLVLRSFIKYVHNRPMLPNLNPSQIAQNRLLRDKQLSIFAVLGVPLTVMFLKFSAIGLKDVFTLTYGGGSQIDNNNNMINTNSSLFLLLSNFNKKIPSWLKIVFKLLFSIILVLKLLGFSIISVSDIFNNLYNLKILSYIICSLIISYQLLNLYLIHKFSNKKIKI